MRATRQPRRLRRLHRVFDPSPSFFLTLCTDGRVNALDDMAVFDRVRSFTAESLGRYRVFVNCFVLMPDHVHLILTVAPDAKTTIGAWVKAFKAMVARHEFRWQAGFFDHVLRSDESRREKWEYIRMNPVRAGLTADADDWPYAQRFSRFDGAEV